MLKYQKTWFSLGVAGVVLATSALLIAQPGGGRGFGPGGQTGKPVQNGFGPGPQAGPGQQGDQERPGPFGPGNRGEQAPPLEIPEGATPEEIITLANDALAELAERHTEGTQTDADVAVSVLETLFDVDKTEEANRVGLWAAGSVLHHTRMAVRQSHRIVRFAGRAIIRAGGTIDQVQSLRETAGEVAEGMRADAEAAIETIKAALGLDEAVEFPPPPPGVGPAPAPVQE